MPIVQGATSYGSIIGCRAVHGYRPTGGSFHPRLLQPVQPVRSRAPMGAIYKPFGLVLSLLAGLVGKRIFNFIWTKIDDEDPPKATTEEAPWSKIITAAAVQGVIFKVTRVVVDRYGARGWSYLTGTWPGEKRPDPDT